MSPMPSDTAPAISVLGRENTDDDQPCGAERDHMPVAGGALRLHILGTGSKGNSCVIQGPEGAILVDAGMTYAQIKARCTMLGIALESIRGIVITHDHSDHIGGLRVTAKNLSVPLYASEGARTGANWHKYAPELSAADLPVRQTLRIAGIQVTPFPVPHDAQGTLGFRFEFDGDSIGYATDIGSVTPEAGEYLRDSRILALESNHDPDMLEGCAQYPPFLKKRIAGDNGHLSNVQLIKALPGLVTNSTSVVVGMHISQNSNIPQLASRALKVGLHHCGRPELPYLVGNQENPMTVA